MRIRFLGVTTLAALCLSGCADRFQAGTPASSPEAGAIAGEDAGPLSVAALPEDLGWLDEGLRLYRSLGAEAGGQSPNVRLQSAGDDLRSLAFAPTGSRAPAAPPGASAGTDLRFVSLPVLEANSGELAVVPAQAADAARGLLPAALTAARCGGRMVALPVAARWLALAYDPARLEEGPTLVPPHLEDWIDQLRSLRRSRPEQPALIVAWSAADVAGSFALLLAARGGRLLDDAGKPTFTGPEGEAALQQMIQMREEGLVQPTALETTSRRLAESLSGPYAYWLCPSDALIPDGSGQDRWARLSTLRLSGLPRAREQYHYPEAATVSLVQYRGLAVSRTSRRLAAAWRLAGFLADPAVLRSAPLATSILAAPPVAANPLVHQAHALVARSQVPWTDPPGLNEALGRFLHAALRKLLTPREALERAALQFQQPGALPTTPESTPGTRPPAEGSAGAPDAAVRPGFIAPDDGGTDSALHPLTAAPDAPHGPSLPEGETTRKESLPRRDGVSSPRAPRPGLPMPPGAHP